jgi:hypothetical protein
MAQQTHSELINELKEVRKKIIKAFVRKQGLGYHIEYNELFDCYFWISAFLFSFDDIVHDLDTNQEPKFILQYLEDCENNPNKTINYQSYCMGLRFDMVQISKPKN